MSLPTAAQNEVVTLACFLLQNFRSILRFIIEKNPDRNVDPGTVFYSKHDDFLTLNRSVKRIMDRLDREYSYHFWNELNKCLRNVLRFSSRRECRLVEVKTNVLNDLAEQIATGVEFELQIQFEVQEALEALMLYRNENQHDASVSEPEPGPSTPSLKQQMANNLNNGATFCPERQIRKRNEDANSNKRATTTTTTLVAPPLPGLSRQSRGTAVSPSTNTNAHQLSNRRPRNSSNRTGGDGRHRWEPETTSARTARTSMKGYSVFGFDCTSTLNPSNLNARELPSADQHRESRRSGFSSDSDVETPVVTLHQQPSEHHGFSSNEDHSDTDEKNSSELTGVHVKVLDRFSERTSNPGLLEKAAQNSTVRRQTPLASNTTGSSRTESSSSSVPYRTPGSIPSSSLYCSGVENVLNRAKDGLLNEPTASNDNTNGAYTRPKHVSSMNIHAPAFVPSSRRPHLPDLSQPGTSLAYDDHHNATNSSGISQSWQASSRNDQNLRFGDNNSNIERFGQSESNSVSSRTHYGSSSTFHDSNQISPLYRSDPNESFRVIAECAAANCKCYILENHPMTTCHGCRAHYHVSCVNDPIKHALPSNKCKRCGFSLKPNRDDQ